MSRSAARVYRPTPRNLRFLAGRLRAGDLVAAPTETVYGLAANALDPEACRRIFRAKRRPASDPLIIHVHSLGQFAEVCQPNAAALKLATAFWPGPLTMVLPKSAIVPPIVTAGGSSVAVRMPRHPVFRRLLKLSALPLAAPSANPFGYISPTTAEHVRQNLGGRIRHIVDGGSARIGLESTIVDLRDPAKPRVLRPGAISASAIEDVLGRQVSVADRKLPPKGSGAMVAPGMLTRHYSPRTPVILHERLTTADAPGEAYIFLRRPAGRLPRNVFWLDPQGRLTGVARRLFATLRQVDAQGFRRIHVELAPGDGLADAINDRLRRAAAQTRKG